MKFTIKYEYDTKARVYRTVSNINGLNLENSCLDDLKKEACETAKELICSNHLSDNEKARFQRGDIMVNVKDISNTQDEIYIVNVANRD